MEPKRFLEPKVAKLNLIPNHYSVVSHDRNPKSTTVLAGVIKGASYNQILPQLLFEKSILFKTARTVKLPIRISLCLENTRGWHRDDLSDLLRWFKYATVIDQTV